MTLPVRSSFHDELAGDARTIVGVLRRRAEKQPSDPIYAFLSEVPGPTRSLTIAELHRRASSIASWLARENLRGERALLLYPAGLEFVEAFFGCLIAGVIAVPASPPRGARGLDRLARVAEDCSARAVLSTRVLLRRLDSSQASHPFLTRLQPIGTDQIREAAGRDSIDFQPAPDALAYLQYTSGSTSEPKGVMVSHANVMANSEDIRIGFGHNVESRSLSWLPHFHDMGLVDGILQPLYSGFPAILMSPASFLQDPARWLEAISRHRITHSGGPNFAYDLCVRRVDPDPSRFDLGSWDVAYNGAEPVRAETLESFAGRFSECGFRRASFYPAYGLAEATLKVSGGSRGEGWKALSAKGEALEAGRVEEDESGRPLVGSGVAGAGTSAIIINAESGLPAPAGRIGEIWVSGPGVALGYWNRAEETEMVFGAHLPGQDGRYLRTGDLGFQRDGQIFVTGRLKDLIIIRGRNLHPQDIERTAQTCHAALRPDAGAAFGLEVSGEERLVLVHEVERRAAADYRDVLNLVRSAILDAHEVAPFAVILVRAGGVPRTSSGKVRRAACRDAFLAGSLPVLAEWRSPEAAEERAPEAGAPDPRIWLAERLARKLGIAVESIDFGASLANLGLDSLRALELAHEIERRFGAPLTPSDLLSAESLSEIIALIEARPSGRIAELPQAGGDARECPLSAGQKAIWFLQEMAPSSAAYTIAAALRLDGPLEEAALEKALGAILARHPSLRARIISGADGPVQRFDVELEAVFSRADWGSPGPDRLPALLADEAFRPFDLAHGPLFRVALVRADDSRVLLISCHHLIADLWSLSVVLRDLQDLYAAALGLEAPPAAAAPHPAEFVAWQAQRIGSVSGERQLEFWCRQLAGDLPALELPVDRARPPFQTFAGGVRTHRLEAVLAEALRRVAREKGVTLYTLLMAAYQTFLHRVTGQKIVLVGSPASGRSHPRFEGLVAYLVNTVVLRADFTLDPPFEAHLAATHERVLGALRHQDYPFAALVGKLAPPRDPSRSPLVDTLFDLHAVGDLVRGDLAAGSGRSELAGGVVAEPLPIDRRASQVDLSATVTDDGRDLWVEWEYNSDLFESATIDALARRFTTLLAAIAASPAERVSQLPLLSADERAAVLRESNANPETTTFVPVYRLFEEQAARRPRSPAAFHEGATLTYDTLNRRANALARRLRDLGVGPESRVAVSLGKSFDLLVALLAVLKAGGAYVPVDPTLPAARRRLMVADCGAGILLARDRLEGDGAPGVRHLGLEEIPALGERGDLTDDLEGDPAPDNLAYIIYTSGTSGAPKGVAVTHANLFSAFRAWDKAYDLRSLSSHLQMAAPGFDVFTGDLVRALGSGGTLVLVDRDTLLDPPALASLARAHRIRFAEFVPAALRELAGHLTRTGERLDSLETVVVGSDAWSMADYDLFRRAFGAHTRLLNSYGVTEATIDSTLDDVAQGTMARPAPAIGRPLANTAAYVLDPRLEPLPAGIRGELCLGGPAVSRGYLGRPDLTAERFQPDPHGPPGTRLYRTGDAARLLPDGRIEFIGRADSQIKIRGFRVEPAEVEAVLKQHPAVRSCVVVPREHASGLRLAAYVALQEGQAGEAASLRSHLAERLPEYMVPSALIVMEALPVSPNGKIDRRALPPPEWKADPPRSAAAPATEAERVLGDIWARILRVERAGPDDNFFELGGDSILGIQIVALAREAGLRLTPRMLFEHPTLAELARRAQAHGTETSRAAYSGDAPLLPMQEWFFAQGFDEPSHWNMAVALDARERLDPGAARRVAAALLEHHDALRARFERGPAGWRQVIDLSGSGKVHLQEIEIGPGESREAAVARGCRLLSEGLDIERSPVIAFGIVADAAGREATLVLAGHHLVLDGVSLRLLAEDFERGYRQARRGEAIVLPPRTEPAPDWAKTLTEAVRAGGLDDEADPWRRAGALPPAPLPLEGSEPSPIEETTAYFQVDLDPAEFEELQRASTAAGERLENVLLAALATACANWTGGRSVWVELEGHGRGLLPDLDVSRTVGWFTQTRPILIDGIEPLDFAATLEAVRGAAGRASGDAFEALRRHSPRPEIREALGRIPAPPISFNYLGRFDALLGEDSLFGALREPSSAQRSPRARRTHALEIDASVVGGKLSVRWSTSRAQLDESTVRRLAGEFRRTLSAFAARLAPQAEIEEALPLTPMQEGMLFHHLREPGKDPYVSQIALELTGDVDPEILGRAWQLAFEAHPALRAGFEWEGRERPVQEIRREVTLPVLQRKEPDGRLEEILAQARASGFDLRRPPLARLDLIRTGPDKLVCAFTHHHILLDGWSLPLTLETVFSLYESLAAGGDVPPRPGSALRRYAEWLAAGDLAAAERYFRGCLDGFASPTPLPDPGGSRAAGAESRVVHEDGPPDAARRAALLGLTPGTLIQAAWALVLSASSGERDVLFGATSSGRPPSLGGIESLVGLCINTLPVRARIDRQVRALEWMRSLQRAGAELRQYEYAPLALVQRCAPIPANTPLFESVLVFENYPLDLAALGRRKHFEVTSVHLHEETNYPLTIVAEQDQGLRFRAVYRTSRYDEPAARAILRRLATAMEELLARPEVLLGEISVLPEAERRRILVEWNETRRPYPRDASLPEVFDRAAREREDEVALSFEGGTMTYAEMRQRSLAVAASLREQGIGPDSRVALAMARSPELFVAMLGVLRAGGAYVPMDPESPPARLRRMLADAGTSLVVSDGRPPLSEAFPEAIGYRDLLSGSPEEAPAGLARAESLAYIMFTSGSTGAPKGVEVTHRNILRLVLGTGYARFGPEQTMLQIAPVAFDASTLEIWSALLHGGRLAIPPPGVVSASEIARLLRDHAVTIAEFPTGLFHLVVDEEIASLAAIPQVIVGGDVIDPARVRRLLGSGCRRVVNAYGPTETATIACCEALTGVEQVGERVPIGRPVANARAYVLDERMAPVPVGAPGELYVGGDGVARGYSSRTDLTAARFVPDPFEGAGLRLYRTGDLVRWKADGRLEFLGRRDGQVKVRGYRVELGEVEKALARIPAIREAVVTARADGESTGLVGYIVCDDPQAGDLGALRRALAKSLPGYMVPSRFVVLDALPVNANGKVDRRSLPAPAAAPVARSTRPLTPVEEAVADLWRRILRVDGIGPQDDFFELGGHSLHAVRLLAALRRAFRVDLPMTAFYDTATVEGVARALIAHQPAEGHVERAARALARMRSMTPAQARELLARRSEEVRSL